MMNCPKCSSQKVIKNGTYNGDQQYRCKDCSKRFYDRADKSKGRKPDGDKPLSGAERFKRWFDKQKPHRLDSARLLKPYENETHL